MKGSMTDYNDTRSRLELLEELGDCKRQIAALKESNDYLVKNLEAAQKEIQRRELGIF